MVDVVEAEPAEARVHTFDHVLARQSGLVGAAPHRHGNLGRKHVLVATQQLAQQRADDLLAGTDAIHVGAIEVEQAALDRRFEDRAGVVDAKRPVALMSPSRFAEIHRAEA